MKFLIGFLVSLLMTVLVLFSFGKGYNHHMMTMIEDCNTLQRTTIGGIPYACAKFVKLKPKIRKTPTYKRPTEFDI